MTKIKQLSPHEAQKIAAGEVVERPAHIIKELIENSIDAGASRITIYIEESGKKLIRIVDNGCGMNIHDAQLCFNRHATSKITRVEELESISTFGFRGEALASIAAVSSITLLTKEPQTLEGTKINISANTITECEPSSCNTGTDITVNNLFFNIPARKKFLKTDQTEWRNILLLFNAFCLDYPHIHFTLFSENKQITNCPSTTTLKNRCLQLWDQQSNIHSIELQKQNYDECEIEGIISNHQHYRYDKNGIHFFVNQRWVKNQQLTNALLRGYANVIPESRYPIAAINITVPTDHVDINIHPRKEEVKFLYPKKIDQALQQAVKTALEKNLSTQIKKEVTFQTAHTNPIFSMQKSESSFKPFNFDNFFEKKDSTPFFMQTFPINTSVANTPTIPEKQINIPIQASTTDNFESTQQVKNFLHYEIIGQYKKTYLLLEKEDGLLLIDQHAAHERILYELFSTRFSDVATIQLLFPPIITLTTQEIEILTPHFDLFTSNGIIIEQCAHNQLIIQSLPVHLKDHSINDLLIMVIGWIIEFKDIDETQFKKTLHEKLHAQMACKAAIKAGDTLSLEKIKQLLEDLDKTSNRFSCPHGRPTGWLISINEIEKKFRRKQ